MFRAIAVTLREVPYRKMAPSCCLVAGYPALRPLDRKVQLRGSRVWVPELPEPRIQQAEPGRTIETDAQPAPAFGALAVKNEGARLLSSGADDEAAPPPVAVDRNVRVTLGTVGYRLFRIPHAALECGSPLAPSRVRGGQGGRHYYYRESRAESRPLIRELVGEGWGRSSIRRPACWRRPSGGREEDRS
jgi:hypothetical protein